MCSFKSVAFFPKDPVYYIILPMQSITMGACTLIADFVNNGPGYSTILDDRPASSKSRTSGKRKDSN